MNKLRAVPRPRGQDASRSRASATSATTWPSILHEEDGAKIVAIGEWDGTVYDPQGLDIAALERHRKKTGSHPRLPRRQDAAQPGGLPRGRVRHPRSRPRSRTRSREANVDAAALPRPGRGRQRPDDARAPRRSCSQKDVLVLPDIFLNAGGVTVSYFEWTKNISHMRYGRLEKRLDYAKRATLVEALEKAGVDRVPRRTTRAALLRGVDEQDLVNSGLEETMITAFQRDRRDPAPAPRDHRPAHGGLRLGDPEGRRELPPARHLPLSDRAGRCGYGSLPRTASM